MRKAVKLSAFILIILITALPWAGAVSLTDGSARFLTRFGDSGGQIRTLSLSIVALAEANGRVKDDLRPKIRDFTRELLSYQNDDGGWGYFPGSVSNVLDTSYAVIALNRALPYFQGTEDYEEVLSARDEGVNFILSSKTENAWGYVAGTTPMFYPTILAVWALGESGYTSNDSAVSSAISALPTLPRYVDDETALGLRLIAFKAVEEPVNESDLQLLMEYLSGQLSPLQRALLTYAMTLYSEPNFEVISQVAKLDEIKHLGGNVVFWADTPKYPISITDTVTPTAYALLALSTLLPPIGESVGMKSMPCETLLSAQNPDGGWGIYRGGPSNEKATYYALLAIEACYPAPEAVEKAINWTKEKLPEDEAAVLSERKLTVAYYYALKTLLRFDSLSDDEKEHALQVIKSIKMDTGKWGIEDLGPQPAQTAMAVDLLIELGAGTDDPDVKAAIEWLSSTSSTGWGLYRENGLYPYLLEMNVLDTLTVLKVLEKFLPENELAPHLQWLVSQRVDGGWPYVREYADMNGTLHTGEPRVDLTVDATLLLFRHGMDYTEDTLKFVEDTLPLIENDTIETASAILYLETLGNMPSADLSDVRNALGTSVFELNYAEGKLDDAQDVLSYLQNDFGFKFDMKPLIQLTSGNHIVLAGFSEVNVSRYNGYIRLQVYGDSVVLNNSTYPREGTVLLIPGKVQNGVVLFVLYDTDSSEVAKLLFKIGYPKYMQGRAVVLRFEDKNNNGKVDLDEVTAEVVG